MEEVLSGFSCSVGVQPRRHGQRPVGDSLLSPSRAWAGSQSRSKWGMGGAGMGPSSTIHHTHQRRMRVKSLPAGYVCRDCTRFPPRYFASIDQRNQLYEQPCTFELALTQLQQHRSLGRRNLIVHPACNWCSPPCPCLRWAFLSLVEYLSFLHTGMMHNTSASVPVLLSCLLCVTGPAGAFVSP
jgi:hypothetical protein